MKLLPFVMVLAVLLTGCQNAKKKAISDLETLLASVEAEKESYQAVLTSINETHKAMLTKNMEGVRAGEFNPKLSEIIAPHKRVALNYEEALKNYLNLIPQLQEVIARGGDETIVAASLANSFDQITGQKDSIVRDMEALKEEHEQYRDTFESI